MKRVLPLLLLLAGCTATPVATTTPPSMTPTTTTTVTTTSARLDTPRKLPADPCQVLVASDFDEPLSGTPEPQPDTPRSCLFRVGAGNDQVVRVRFADAYVRPDQSMELLVGDGHSAAMTCAETPNGIECTELVAVNATESLEVVVFLRGGNSGQVAKAVQGYAGDAFARMVVTS